MEEAFWDELLLRPSQSFFPQLDSVYTGGQSGTGVAPTPSPVPASQRPPSELAGEMAPPKPTKPKVKKRGHTRKIDVGDLHCPQQGCRFVGHLFIFFFLPLVPIISYLSFLIFPVPFVSLSFLSFMVVS